MWPSIPASRSFGNVACPSGASCELPYCIFSHSATTPNVTQHANSANSAAAPDVEPETKRPKLNEGTKQSTQAPAKPVFVGSIVPRDNSSIRKDTIQQGAAQGKVSPGAKSNNEAPRSATRPISPPPKIAETKAAATPEVKISLTPRKLVKEPAQYTKRLTLVQALKKFIIPLNDKIKRVTKPEVKALHLSDNQLNKLVLDEEEKIAKENTAVYENVIKQRLVALKKMSVEEWANERVRSLTKEKGEAPRKTPPKKVDTGLTAKEEIIFLSTLISSQDGLDAHGYVTRPPTESEIEESRAAQLSAAFWEVCDRCNTRFQVFPERREEDGALTTGGECKHHWGRRIFGKRIKGAPPQPTLLSCCNEPVGSPGCTTHPTHVFKISEAKRLSTVMPFIKTPPNDKVKPHTAICFDCEMGYTTHGLELLRLTAVSWPTHRPIIDVLVRPIGHLLDVNTRFSGVSAEQFLNAKPYDPRVLKIDPKDLRIVDSPYAARDLFLSHVSPSTPVLGHALENDLNAIRLIHPTIVDTIILFPHRGGLPLRNGLRNLTKTHLGIDIQQGGAAGHNSLEDARATGELVRFKIAEKWKTLKEDGWVIRDDGVYPPMPPDAPPPQAPTVPSMVPSSTSSFMTSNPAEKRKHSEVEGE